MNAALTRAGGESNGPIGSGPVLRSGRPLAAGAAGRELVRAIERAREDLDMLAIYDEELEDFEGASDD